MPVVYIFKGIIVQRSTFTVFEDLNTMLPSSPVCALSRRLVVFFVFAARIFGFITNVCPYVYWHFFILSRVHFANSLFFPKPNHITRNQRDTEFSHTNFKY